MSKKFYVLGMVATQLINVVLAGVGVEIYSPWSAEMDLLIYAVILSIVTVGVYDIAVYAKKAWTKIVSVVRRKEKSTEPTQQLVERAE
jgi:hypothetical protein